MRRYQCTTSGRRTPGPHRAEPIETEIEVMGMRPIEIGQIEIMVPRPPDMTVVGRRAMTAAAGRMAQVETPISHL
ncbi:MAG TPA: hypothetical protein VG125_15075, partial [Pirellulales bacterium]|nr:hypothetical protein [Pirellulales bacterium]